MKNRYYDHRNGKPFIAPTLSTRELAEKIRKYEDRHIGGYYRTYPSEESELPYEDFMRAAKIAWDELTGPRKIRI